MGNKGRLIFGILIIVLVPVFAYGIWKEVENNSASGLEKGLNKKIAQSALPGQGTMPSNKQAMANPAPANPQNKPMTPESPKVAAAENTAENNTAELPKNEENSADTNNKDKNNYENKDLGISFDYPKDYAVALEGNRIVTISKGDISWKIRLYDNKNKEDIQAWYGNKFNKEDNLDCNFSEPVIKAGTCEGKLVKSGIDKGKCADAGNYSINSDKTKVIRIYENNETSENINKVLEGFKFL